MDKVEKKTEPTKVEKEPIPISIIIFGDEFCHEGEFITTLLKNAISTSKDKQKAIVESYMVPINLKSNNRDELAVLYVINATAFKIDNGFWSKLICFWSEIFILLRTKLNKDYKVEDILNVNPKWIKELCLQIVLTEEDQPTMLIESIHMPIITETKIYEILEKIIRKASNDNSICISPGQVPTNRQ